MIKVIVGLGNPGQQYEKTRHNVGFIFLDHLVSVQGASWSSNRQFQGEVASYESAGVKLVLLKPMTYMNKSGLAVGQLLRYYKFNPEEMLVVHDELELSEGMVRMKRDGGHAGHNGLRDIISHIDSRDFYRLRVGIGRPAAGGVADYVLSSPSAQGRILLEKTIELMTAQCELLVKADLAGFNNIATKLG